MSTNIVARYAEKKKENHIHARMVGGASDIDKRNRIKLATWNCESKGVSFLSSQVRSNGQVLCIPVALTILRSFHSGSFTRFIDTLRLRFSISELIKKLTR